MNKLWKIYPKVSDDIFEQLLKNRGVWEKREEFLNPKYEDLPDPFLLSGVKMASDLILKTISKKKKIALFGDYDADGVPGTALLYEALKKLGVVPEVYIPTREEGYGLNERAIRKLKKQAVNLLITVDCGIKDVKEIKLAQKLGMDVIVTDHHEVPKILPPARVIINPKKKNERYPTREISGGAVAFKLVQGLAKKSTRISESFLKWSLDLVGITTICEVVPLLEENRILAKFGLIVLAKTRRVGLQKLYQVAGINQQKIDTWTVGFQIGPRINAPGRMDSATNSFYLLTTQDEILAQKLAYNLNQINILRQKKLDRVLKEAQEKIQKQKLYQKKVVLIDGEGWPSGIIGLVAGKLQEKYARPVLVIERRGEKGKGSARSVNGFHLVEVLDELSQLLLTHGGHAKAAGFSLEMRHLESLYDKLLEIAETKLKDRDLIPKIQIDAELPAKKINLNLLNDLKKLEPFGLGNPKPIFLTRNLKIIQITQVGSEGKHLRLTLEGENKQLKAIGFDMVERLPELKPGFLIDIVYNLEENFWDGEKYLDIKLKDFRSQ